MNDVDSYFAYVKGLSTLFPLAIPSRIHSPIMQLKIFICPEIVNVQNFLLQNILKDFPMVISSLMHSIIRVTATIGTGMQTRPWWHLIL